ncbi:MAG: hypothetical protein VX871_11695 [Pseudomonadota bacterium]|nr:hypothetical protein [Pseudomonadota bacterium]
MADTRQNEEFVRLKLISMLPRLRRFAVVLAGETQAADTLLREGCERMLAECHRYRRGTPFDRWAFAELYGCWMGALREHPMPMPRGRGDGTAFLPDGASGRSADGDAARMSQMVAALSPQQRSAALLIYGEKLAYHDAAKVLDTTTQSVIARVGRALASLMNRMTTGAAVNAAAATVKQLYPESPATKQASQ